MSTAPPAPEPDATPDEAPSRLKRAAGVYGWVSDILTPKTLGIVLAALVLVVVAAAGGLKSATAEAESPARLPSVGVDQDIDAKPFTVQVHKAMQGDQIGHLVPRKAGVRLIAVSLLITNNDTVPAGQGLGAALADFRVARVELPGLRWYGQPREWEQAIPAGYRADSATLSTLQPGLKQRIVLVWEQAAGEPVPTEVAVVVSALTHRRSSLDGSMMWLDPTPVARVTLPVTEIPQDTP